MQHPSLIYLPSNPEAALRQGEILTNVVQVKIDAESIGAEGGYQASDVIHPYAIVVSQDCDLDWDYKAREQATPPNQAVSQDKLLPNILFCEVTTAEALKGRKEIHSSIWSRIKINKDERYHFLQKVEPDHDALYEGLPELGIDFKRYFSIPTEEVYARLKNNETQRRCCLASPYLEHFSLRFSHFQCRVALPEDHKSEP